MGRIRGVGAKRRVELDVWVAMDRHDKKGTLSPCLARDPEYAVRPMVSASDALYLRTNDCPFTPGRRWEWHRAILSIPLMAPDLVDTKRSDTSRLPQPVGGRAIED